MDNQELLAKVFAELVELFRYMDYKDLQKIPSEFKKKILNEQDPNHNFIYDIDKDIEHQNILEETKGLYAFIYYKFCLSEEDKKKYMKIWIENDKKEEAQKLEKYNPNDIFKSRNLSEMNEVVSNLEKNKKPKNMFSKLKNIIKKGHN